MRAFGDGGATLIALFSFSLSFFGAWKIKFEIFLNQMISTALKFNYIRFKGPQTENLGSVTFNFFQKIFCLNAFKIEGKFILKIIGKS